MKNDLPISIKVSSILGQSFTKISSVVVKHEAHFNFQTLAAGWYDNEDNILIIELVLLTMHEFTQQTTTDSFDTKTDSKTDIADDVVSYFKESTNKVTCFIAITNAEEIVLIKQPKLLTSYIKAKLLKVVNCIAKEHKKVSL